MSTQVTLKEIADALGVSAMTVSRAINNKPNVDEDTRGRVLEKARSMGYTPNHVAKSLVSKKTYTIGVVIPEISHAFFPEVVRGIEEVSYSSNYHLILTHSAEQFRREKDAIDTLRAKRVDGVLISSCQTLENYSFYEQVIESGTRIVFFDRCIEGIGASCVSVNDRESSKLITRHLIDHGYKKIAHLSGPTEVSIGKKRCRGYLEAMEEAGIRVDPRWIVESGFQESGARKAMTKLLQLPKAKRPRAVVAVNDPVAFGAMEAINERGLEIPGDIALVGFTDEVRSELVNPPLTTIHQPAYEVGKKGAEKLINTIEKEQEPVENIEVKTDLVIRESCGCEI
ncbi:MAG: LacI family DNA-binding transcriptional regulator [Balneolaceae bacterium]|nr:LacI family DNA-binding transcriptional regulator [Balneolaceae bacterium]